MSIDCSCPFYVFCVFVNIIPFVQGESTVTTETKQTTQQRKENLYKTKSKKHKMDSYCFNNAILPYNKGPTI